MTPTPQQMKVAELSSRVSEVSGALLDISKAESTTEKALTEQVSKLDIIAYDLVTLQSELDQLQKQYAATDEARSKALQDLADLSKATQVRKVDIASTQETTKTEIPVPTPPVVETPAVTPPPVTTTTTPIK